ncbi:hypothetical protein JNW88_15145, partial [Micromonospora sp. ATA32]|nr:hypothetical protein [Micromonospora sp. ATA32]
TGADPADTAAAARIRLAHELTRLSSSNFDVTAAWRCAVDDLAVLPLGEPAGPTAPMAGLPIYQEIFGRDTMTASWQALLAGPTMLKDSLRLNARHLGRRVDDWRDEEPGKPLHEARRGPVSLLGLDPFADYHGDWSTAPDFLVFLGQYLAWTGDLDTVRDLLPTARRALDWIDRYGDPDRDGLLEYHRRSPAGLKNQGWKDSDTAVVDEHGRVVANPIATSELQAYWYAGLRHAAVVFAMTGHPAFGAALLARAAGCGSAFTEPTGCPSTAAMRWPSGRTSVRYGRSTPTTVTCSPPASCRPGSLPWWPAGYSRPTCSAVGGCVPSPPRTRRTTRSATTGAASGRWRRAPSVSGWRGTAAGSTCTGWPRGCSPRQRCSRSTGCRGAQRPAARRRPPAPRRLPELLLSAGLVRQRCHRAGPGAAGAASGRAAADDLRRPAPAGVAARPRAGGRADRRPDRRPHRPQAARRANLGPRPR